MRFLEEQMDAPPTATQTASATAAASEPSRLIGAMANTLGDLVDSIAALDRMESAIAAHKAELVDQARRWSEVVEASSGSEADSGWSSKVRARRVLVSELACALRIPERTAESLVADCAALLGALPQTFRALSEGAITWRHARVLIDHTRTLPDDARELFEATVLPFAKTLTVAKFDRRARIQREHAHPESIDMRSKDAISERFVDVTPDRDGMAWLNAYLPAVVAQGIYNRITDIAVSCQGPTEQRTLGHLRADVFADLLVDGVLSANGHGGIRAQVLVTVPVLALLGRSDEPAVLEGFGPIDLSTARELAAAAPSFTRLLTHPETGAVLSVGRTRYAVPADLRTWLRVRDGTCRFPGAVGRPANANSTTPKTGNSTGRLSTTTSPTFARATIG